MTIRASMIGVLVLLGAGCRFGGPEGSPTELIEIDAGVPAEEDAEVDLDDGNDLPAQDAASNPVPTDAPLDAPDAAAPTSPDAAASCGAPPDLECDPVSGEGCLPLMQCVADPASSTPAAYCVFSGLLLDVCVQDELSTNCPPQHTCVMGECRKYCYCDADCDAGTPCGDSGGDGAFELCAGSAP